MKRFLLALTLFLAPSLAVAQCNGVFSPLTICGTVAGGIPGQVSTSVLTGIPGGSPGQVQFNNSGAFGGLTNTQLTADINAATASLSGAIPAWPNNTTTFFRGDGTYAPFLAVVAAKTSSYPIVSTDCNTTIPLGTGTTAQFTVTLPALPSAGFTAGCTIFVKNNDVYSGIGTGHAMTLSGFPSDLNTFLWPQQSAAVQVNSAGTAWVTIVNPGRWILPQSAEICYAQNGNDANDGLGAGAGCMALVQSAVNVIGKQWDGTGYNNCSIGIYTGGTNTINEAVSQTGQSIGCYLTVNFRGAVTWNTAGSCWSTGDNAIVIHNMNLGFVPTLQCNNTNLASTCQFYGHQTVIWDINGSFEWNPQGSNDCLVFMDAQGRAVLGLTTIVIGSGAVSSADSILNCNSGCSGIQVGGTIAFSANVTVNQMFRIQNGGYVNTAATFTGSPTTTNPSNPRGNSRLITNGTTIPGGAPSGVTGGQVCTNTAC